MKNQLSLLLTLVLLGTAVAQDFNPTFPRTMYFSPGGYYGSSRDYFLSKYDLAQPAGGNSDHVALAESTRVHNPEIIFGGTSYQGAWPFNTPPEMFAYHATYCEITAPVQENDTEIRMQNITPYDFPSTHNYALIGDNDWVRFTSVNDTTLMVISTDGDYRVNQAHEAGTPVRFPIRMSGFGMLHNVTPLAPQINGKEAWRWFIDYRFQMQDFSAYDAVFYDAFRANLFANDLERAAGLDLDQNRIDDFEEHGLSWINDQWQQGVEKMLTYEHQRMQELHPDKYALETLNTGTVIGGYIMDYADGMLWEGFMRFAYDWYSMVDINLEWEKKQAQKGRPNMTMICDYEKESRTTGRDQFNRMRYGLTTACISGAYYGRTFGDWCYIGYYHDEFDTDLGYPTSEPQELPSGAWVRFFDKGAAICNPTGQIINVTSAELQSAAGYDGPYYRLRGGQTPEFNNGKVFDTVELYGEVRNPDRPRDNQGDGILLFKEPTTVVADIWIGNTYNNDTSPGNDPVEYVGSWVEVRDAEGIFPTDNVCFSQWSHTPYYGAAHDDGIGYAYASPGDGSDKAVFRPSIGVPGYYEIAEWHGYGSGVSTNTPFAIKVNGEIVLNGIIDQTQLAGQWNTLGYVYLPKGENSHVELTNNANGYVLADAVMFRYMGDTVNPDQTPPQAPTNVQVHEQ